MQNIQKYDWPDPIPGFDVIKWKREIQTQIYEETKDMTTAEWLTYIRKGAERFDEKQRLRHAEYANEQ